MNMQERLKELIKELDPDIQAVVAEVILLEREHLDWHRPKIKEDVRDIIDKYARRGMGET